MTFYVENEFDFEFGFDVENLIKSLTEETLKSENVPFLNVSLNVSFTDDENIHVINKEFRDMDKSTDVLSFPAIDFNAPADFSGIKEGDPEYFDCETGELILGDIMISTDHAVSQAGEYGHSLKREVAFLITHSLLHLLGYDHESDDEREVMEAKQEEILKRLNITRD
ncbi:MAG: rRNA maturation RNase YbeY [Lachnospiraceae bacterium]|nr:rRNA maturation RNase YbeY [Lachnospiraceae bacterium]